LDQFANRWFHRQEFKETDPFMVAALTAKFATGALLKISLNIEWQSKP